MLNICLSMSKYPLGSNLEGTGDWGGDWGFRVGIGFLRCLSMSKYPLGSNLGGTGVGTGGLGWGLGLQGPPHAKRMSFYVKVCFRV